MQGDGEQQLFLQSHVRTQYGHAKTEARVYYEPLYTVGVYTLYTRRGWLMCCYEPLYSRVNWY